MLALQLVVTLSGLGHYKSLKPLQGAHFVQKTATAQSVCRNSTKDG
jgi:hypothetical protein